MLRFAVTGFQNKPIGTYCEALCPDDMWMDCSGMDNDATCVVNEKYKFVPLHKAYEYLVCKQ